MHRKIPFLFLVFCFYIASAQQKEVVVKYIDSPITVDALLDEVAWSQAEPAKDFWQYFPTDTIQAKNQ